MRARKCIALLLLLLLVLARPVPAAWSSLGTLGSNQSKTANQSSLVLTTSAAAEAGNVVVVAIACDNFGTTDADDGAVSSIIDSAGGNAWSKAREWTNGQGTAQLGATVSLWYSKLTNQINSGGTITANFTNNTSRDATAITAWEFSIGAGNVVTVEATNVSVEDGADIGALDATTPNAEFLRMRAIAREKDIVDITTWTNTASWTDIPRNGTTGAGTASNMSVLGEFRVSTGTGDSSDPTISGLQDGVTVYVALKEAAPSARNRIWSSKAGSQVMQQGKISRIIP